MKQQVLKFLSALLGMAALTVATLAGALTISNVPLFVSEGVDPNVMLLLDNSGSMRNLLWSSAFDPKTIYPDWSVGVPASGGSAPGCTTSNTLSGSAALRSNANSGQKIIVIALNGPAPSSGGGATVSFPNSPQSESNKTVSSITVNASTISITLSANLTRTHLANEVITWTETASDSVNSAKTKTFIQQNGQSGCFVFSDTHNYDYNWGSSLGTNGGGSNAAVFPATNTAPNSACPTGYLVGHKVVLTGTNTAWTPPSGNYSNKGFPNITRITKCIRFPNPLSLAPDNTTTWMLGNYMNFLFENAGTTKTDILSNTNSTTKTQCANNITFTSGTGAVEPVITCRRYANIDFWGGAGSTPALTNVNVTAGGLTIPNSGRIQTSRKAVRGLVDGNTSYRWGVFTFDSDQSGGSLQAACGTKISETPATALNTVDEIIDGITASTSTPLAETYYEITRYFRGLSRSLASSGPATYTSPITHRCQKSYVIVVTDGYPTYDNNVPSNASGDPAGLPNWDNAAPTTTTTMFDTNTTPQYSDGFKPSSGGRTEGDEGYTLYLDDLAKFGYDTDMRTTGLDGDGISFNDPKYNNGVQNLRTYTIGLSIDNQMLKDAAQYGHGKAFSAQDEAQLAEALTLALASIANEISSASSVATNSTRLTANSYIYQARFATGDWSGQLLAFKINESTGLANLIPDWDAADELPAWGSRHIYTLGTAFEYSALSAANKAYMDKDVLGNAEVAPNKHGSARVDFIRGDSSNEDPNGLDFRSRTNRLGDIVNSDPAYVGNLDYGYEILAGTEGSTYKTYLDSGVAGSRDPMVYVGANDGMLHGFNADTGAEVVAYVPGIVIPDLRFLPDINYIGNAHRYYVDGSPTVSDAYLGGAWKTILVGGLGGGGKGVYALDVTNPSTFTGTNPDMWEFTTSMGYSVPPPAIGRMNNGVWAAIVPNGYLSSSGHAVLHILNLSTGAVIKTLDTNVGDPSNFPNGLSSPAPVDTDADGVVDYIYAGDLLGNLWKFDVSDGDPANWKIALSGHPLYVACDPKSMLAGGSCVEGSAAADFANHQTITSRPDVTANPAGGTVVLFGTGRYLQSDDDTIDSNTQTQTFYGIRDRNATGQSTVVGRTTLVQQSITAQTTVTAQDASVQTIRGTTSNLVPVDKNGWFMDLLPPGVTLSTGERVVANPQVRSGRIIFTSLIPKKDPCGFGGDSFLYELDVFTGSRLKFTPFDVNKDKSFTTADYITIGTDADGKPIKVPPSGIKSNEGIIKTPAFIGAGDYEYGYASGTSGNIYQVTGSSGLSFGRQSWRQIQ